MRRWSVLAVLAVLLLLVVSPFLVIAVNALRRLDEPYRTAVILRDVEGLSQEEIARIMNCPRGTAKSRIQRGRYQLRDLLRPFVQPDVS